MFSCEFYQISKNTFFHRTPLVTASVYNNHREKLLEQFNTKICKSRILAASDFSFNLSMYKQLGSY